MIERVTCFHPDKIADRIAGALLDLAYAKNENPRINVELFVGCGTCDIVIESTEAFTNEEVENIVHRISPETQTVNLRMIHIESPETLKKTIKCEDNGIFKGVPLTNEEIFLSSLVKEISEDFPYDGDYIYDEDSKRLIICQSNISEEDAQDLKSDIEKAYSLKVSINPSGLWVGGTDVTVGVINRRLNTDLGKSITCGGLHGKDLSKSGVSASIYAFMKAQEYGRVVEMFCIKGDDKILCRVQGRKDEYIPIKDIISYAKDVINGHGGFEAMAERGLF